MIVQDNHRSLQKMQDCWKKFENVVIDKDEEISCPKNHSQSLIAQIKMPENKKMQKEKLEQCIDNKSLLHKETMTNLVEVGISLEVEGQTMYTDTSANPSASTNKISVINGAKQVYEEDITPKVVKKTRKL